MDHEATQILVVDDFKSQFTMIKDFLSLMPDLADCQLTWAPTYDAALSLIQETHYDLYLIDYNLGQDSGLDLLHQIRAADEHAILILMTGEGSRQLDLEAMRRGAIDYIDKTEMKPTSLERTIRYAIQHRRALQREQEQRLIAEVLLDTVAALNSTLELDKVLERILTNVGKIIPHETANIMLIEDDFTRVIGCQGYEPESLQAAVYASSFSVSQTASFRHMAATRQPLMVPDVRENPDWIKTSYSDELRSYLGAPIVVGDTVLGFINLDGFRPGFFSQTHAVQLQAFANHAAIAIQNARVYEQAQELATIEERQRLARDLHDAVSQTLFSANMIAESLPFMWRQDPDTALEYLTKLTRLTKGALSEMRALLLELRPDALAETDFDTLLKHLVKAFEGRTDANIALDFDCEGETLPTDIKLTLYRIAQEALNNITKHANASHVAIRYHYYGTGLEFNIRDNGQGFDPVGIPKGHMGLEIMQERARNIGAILQIHSQPGAGSEVGVIWNKSNRIEA